jgi:CheY-like chemotaxis protein
MTVPLPPLLVVDDEKNMRLSLQTMLGDEGYGVLAVESAEAGLELLAKENVFMVITDARLGGMSGYDFLHKARNRWPTPRRNSPSRSSRPGRWIISPNRLRPKNCCMRFHVAPSGIAF